MSRDDRGNLTVLSLAIVYCSSTINLTNNTSTNNTTGAISNSMVSLVHRPLPYTQSFDNSLGLLLYLIKELIFKVNESGYFETMQLLLYVFRISVYMKPIEDPDIL